MNTRELASFLERSGVDPDRYWIADVSKARAWNLRPAGSVWLSGGAAGPWSVGAAGIPPHHVSGDVAEYAREDEACRAFAAELTRTDGREAFAEAKAAFGAACAREWREAEERLAGEEPGVFRRRERWRRTWREREAAGEPVMTVAELLPALDRCGVEPGLVRVEGVHGTGPDDGNSRVVRRDERGRWLLGHWPTGTDREYRHFAFVIDYRFATEGELCAHCFEDLTGPWDQSPPLTAAQWREQLAVARDNEAAEAEARWDHYVRHVQPPEMTTLSDLFLRLLYRGVRNDAYGLLGDGHTDPYAPYKDADAVVLAHEPGADPAWWAETRIGEHPVVLRRFASREEAFRVFEAELTRRDGTPPFAGERVAAEDEGL